MIRITYAPDLVEESVLLAERTMTAGDRRAFRRERDPIYVEAEGERRDERFGALHTRWFDRLGLRQVVDGCIAERLNIVAKLTEARVLRAITRNEEGADLVDRLVSGLRAQPILAVRIRPETLLDAPSAGPLLRRELQHVDDMLDDGFGYEPSLPPSELGPLGDTLVQARYRVLWNVTVDGRLSRAGLAEPGAEIARRREFAAAFAMLGPLTSRAFERWFNENRPTHAALAEFARTPSFEVYHEASA